nr:MAG TPA: hypothetical protein [Caudoviricetes sp.]
MHTSTAEHYSCDFKLKVPNNTYKITKTLYCYYVSSPKKHSTPLTARAT